MSATCSQLREQKTINLHPLTTAFPEDTCRQHPHPGQQAEAMLSRSSHQATGLEPNEGHRQGTSWRTSVYVSYLVIQALNQRL